MTVLETPEPSYHPWSSPAAEVFIPDGSGVRTALRSTTHLGIGAHADDLEIMAYQGILAAYDAADRSAASAGNGASGGACAFTGVTMSDGRSSARVDAYAGHTDEQMVEARRREQRRAASIGRYRAMVQLQHPSAALKDAANVAIASDLDALLAVMRPAVVYTHNLADKHDTHVAVALRVIAALRRLPAGAQPARVIGCEVWRDLDWLADGDKVVMEVDGRPELESALLGVFDSQIGGGKRYDLGARGRRAAHATFYETGATDQARAVIFGMDLTPLVRDPGLDPAAFVDAHIARFADDVRSRIAKWG